MTALVAALGILPLLQKPYPLMVGDMAPKLSVSKWVQGAPIDRFQRGQVYVVDFWSTWCGPCLESVPKLSRMQREYGAKVNFIGIDVWDYQERVPALLKEMGSDFNYRVALDRLPPRTPSEDNVPMWAKEVGACSLAWLKSSGADGIPVIFLIGKDGRIAWIGNDVSELDTVTKEVLAGTWDLTAAAKRHHDRASRQVQINDARTQMFSAIGRKHWEEAIKHAENLRALEPGAAAGPYFEALLYIGRHESAFKEASAALAGDDGNLLHQMAHQIVFGIELRSEAALSLAESLAKRANDLSNGERGATLEILARIAWFRRDRQAAINLQEKAIAKTQSSIARERATKRLEDYKRVGLGLKVQR